MSPITTHVLDIARGRPAAGVPVVLTLHEGDAWRELGRGVTDADGRLRTLLPADAPLGPGVYRLLFDTGAYFAASGVDAFHPEASVVFTEFPPAHAYKATIERRIASGAVGDTDVYGAQQHAPLLDVDIPI